MDSFSSLEFGCFLVMMKTNWSVFKRRLKTPLQDYKTLREIALLISKIQPPFFFAVCFFCFQSFGNCRKICTDQYLSTAPSQADVVTFKAFSGAPDAEKYPNVARWYKHIASYESEFSKLPGDASKAYTAYGPEASETNPKDKPADDDDMDLFGSDDEEEDPEVVKEREARLAEYKKKKESKPKAIAKSLVTLEVKPWGK